MTVQKILNNNVAITRNERGQECVVTGRGIVFEKKKGDEIDPARVEKIFALQERGAAERLSRLIENIPPEHLQVCDEIITTAKRELNGLSDAVYLNLIDHISFALERHKNNMDIASSLKWEMKRFYPDEFRIGIKALDLIERRLNMRLPDDEAAFIAFHLVNAGKATSPNLEGSLRLIQGILKIIKRTFAAVKMDENSPAYGRLLMHLKYFSMRVFDKDAPGLKQASSGLLYRLEGEFPGESSCVEEIAGFVRDTCNYTISNDEKSYLIIHIHSLAAS
ncbi:MAG: PRD domain-containing protein [Treponema sp.]|jgi:beta-glucoside operon transcriptional antiterminator|nr:PRD domain-containing protein [Treponema sp.]